jgi:uncharacterized membrane protein
VIRSLHTVLVIGATLWCLAIIGAPLLHWTPLYLFFSTICHQLPDRSWHIHGEPLALCIRCTSISFGFLAGLLAFTHPNVSWFRWALAITVGQWLLAMTLIDSEVLRALSGLLLGATAAPIIRLGIGQMITERIGTPHESM